jgi:TetR/AcrR family transcriptional repressor of lmrAB and yxaGH operons
MAHDTKERILRVTSELMRRRGFAATGLKDISDAAGVAFSSLYFHFPGGKEQMAAEAVRASARGFLEYLDAELPKATTVEGVVRAYFDPGIRALETSDFQAGCPVGTPANDAATSSETVRSACDAALRDFEDRVARALEHLGQANAQARATATLVVATNQGALLLARTAHDRAPIQAALDSLVHLIA